MGEAIVFAVMGTVWLIFRKGIARQQAQIITVLFGRGEVPEGRMKGLEQLGMAFSILLLAAAAAIGVVALASRA
ncbi:hypothetical protein J7E83_18720 [Arthrobacter sp. ISL-48]|uniref:hypothetical protein n=1 Tax=Arthrobacter sp. ISL-48 TaxID=2819110 RepID=UPI001BE6ADFC|nr:hypothetical protein [Arthrobacter sp. ISL-48]MBT2534121.1 hypothetical protein [Arthrobacter sp. ISL-48]